MVSCYPRKFYSWVKHVKFRLAFSFVGFSRARTQLVAQIIRLCCSLRLSIATKPFWFKQTVNLVNHNHTKKKRSRLLSSFSIIIIRSSNQFSFRKTINKTIFTLMSLKANILSNKEYKKKRRWGHGAGEENTLLRYMGTCTMMLLIILMSPHIYVFAFIQLPFFVLRYPLRIVKNIHKLYSTNKPKQNLVLKFFIHTSTE